MTPLIWSSWTFLAKYHMSLCSYKKLNITYISCIVFCTPNYYYHFSFGYPEQGLLPHLHSLWRSRVQFMHGVLQIWSCPGQGRKYYLWVSFNLWYCLLFDSRFCSNYCTLSNPSAGKIVKEVGVSPLSLLRSEWNCLYFRSKDNIERHAECCKDDLKTFKIWKLLLFHNFLPFNHQILHFLSEGCTAQG